jgi:ATPase subunit of ABC transporter with duplicated ATPase domains
LARLLLLRPGVQLLDEPDNHLDIPGKAYFEALIRSYAGALVLASHDRYLLDRTVEPILALEDGRVKEYIGGSSDYAKEKERTECW